MAAADRLGLLKVVVGHRPVTLTKARAQLISRAIGRPPSVPRTSIRISDIDDERDQWRDIEALLCVNAKSTRFSFLEDQKCSIYER